MASTRNTSHKSALTLTNTTNVAVGTDPKTFKGFTQLFSGLCADLINNLLHLLRWGNFQSYHCLCWPEPTVWQDNKILCVPTAWWNNTIEHIFLKQSTAILIGILSVVTEKRFDQPTIENTCVGALGEPYTVCKSAVNMWEMLVEIILFPHFRSNKKTIQIKY